MSTETTIDISVRTHIVVDAPIERAFRIFIDQFDRIQPREHNLLGVEIAETVFEPRVGGHVEVDIRFIAESSERTRVELEHRHLDRHGEGQP